LTAFVNQSLNILSLPREKEHSWLSDGCPPNFDAHATKACHRDGPLAATKCMGNKEKQPPMREAFAAKSEANTPNPDGDRADHVFGGVARLLIQVAH